MSKTVPMKLGPMLPYVHIHTGSKLTKMAVAYKYKLLYAAIFQDAQLKILILLLFCSLDIVSQVTIHGKVYIQYFFLLKLLNRDLFQVYRKR